MESYENILKLDELTEKYQKEAESTENWVFHLKAHGLANRCLAKEFSQVRQQKVYEIEQTWYKGRHPLAYDEHTKLTNEHLQLLKNYRNETKADFDSIDTTHLKLDNDPTEDHLSFFCDSVFNLSQKCSNGFIKICKSIVQSSVDILSKSGLKVPCSFAVVALGSVARGMATPYSDLEYIFVVESDSHMDYFAMLAVDSYFRIGNMKESPLKSFDIAEIGKKYSDNVPVGFHIDGISLKAGNIPTGRGDGDKNLILTIEQLTDVYRKALVSPAGDTADIGDLLSSQVLIYAYKHGTTLYKTAIENCHAVLKDKALNTMVIKKRLQILEQDVKTYDFLPSFESFGPPDNTKLRVKSDLFRYPTLLLDHLRLLLGFYDATPWAVTKKLKTSNFIDEKQCFKLNLVTALAIYIRTTACIQLQSQNDEFSLYPCARPNKKIYDLACDIFILMVHTVVPLKLCIAQNLVALTSLTTLDSSDVVKKLLADSGLIQPSFMLKAEAEYFCGHYEQAIRTITANCGTDIFGEKPDVFVDIVENAITKNLKTGSTPTLLNDPSEFKKVKTSKQYVELAAYLLYSTHKYHLSLKYFIWLAKEFKETPLSMLKWKILAADSANKLHDYYEAFSQLGDVCSTLKRNFGGDEALSPYRFVKSMCTASKISGKDQHWFEVTAQAFRVLSQSCENTKYYIQAEEMANTAMSVFDKLHKNDKKNRLDSHYVELILSLALIHSKNKEHKKGIQYINHHLTQLTELHTECIDHPDIALLLRGLGQIYETMEDYKRSMHFYGKALSMTKNLHPTTVHVSVAQCYRDIGTLEVKKSNYTAALINYNIARQTFDLLNICEHEKAGLLVEMGLLYNLMEKYDSALSTLSSALNMLDSVAVTTHIDIANIHSAYGKVHHKLGNNTLALKHLHIALEMTERVFDMIKDIPILAQFHGEMGKLSVELNARANLLNMKIADRDVKSVHPDIASCYLDVASVYFEMCLPDQSLLYIKKSCDMYRAVYGKTSNVGVARAYDGLGAVYVSIGEYSKALEYHTESLMMKLTLYGVEATHADIASSYNKIGLAYSEMGEYSKALEYHTKSLEVRLAVYGAEATHTDIATSFNNIGLVYYKIGEYSKALEYHTKSLEMILAVHGAEATHTDIAASYNSIGLVYCNMSKYSKALEYYTKSLDIWLAVYCAEATHAHIAISYNNIANVYDKMGEYGKALKCYTKSLEMTLAVYGAETTHVASSYNNIGTVYQNMGENRKALEYHTKSLEIILSIYGAEATHTDIFTSFNNIGLVYCNMGEYSKALHYYTKSLDIMLAAYGAEAIHADIATSNNNIGSVYNYMGEYKKSLEQYTKSLDMWLAVYGAEATHTNIAVSYNNIGGVYQSMGEYSKALKYYTKSSDMWLAVYGAEATHADIATSYNNFGSVYDNMGEYSKALKYYTKSLEMLLVLHGAEATHAHIATSYNNIGTVYHNMGEDRKALEYYTKSLEMFRTVDGFEATHADIPINCWTIGRMYYKKGEYGKALEYYTKS